MSDSSIGEQFRQMQRDIVDLKRRVEGLEWIASGKIDPERYEKLMSLVGEIAHVEPVGYGAESSIRYCAYCRADDDGSEYVVIEHAPFCPWAQLRTFWLSRE